MANIRLNNTTNSLNVENGIYPIQFLLNGQSVDIFSQRAEKALFFENGAMSNFPADVSGNYVGGKVSVNFQTGAVSGADAYSGNFAPIIPSANNYRLATVYIDRDNRLRVSYSLNNFASYSTLFDGFVSGSRTAFGALPEGIIQLFSVILTSTNGTTVSNLLDANFFSRVPNFGALLRMKDVRHTDTNFDRVEYLSADAFSGDGSVKVKKTLMKVGEAFVLERQVGTNILPEYKTVTNIVYGAVYDEVFFTPVVIYDNTLDLAPRIRKVASDLSSAMGGYEQNVVYDSGWIFVSSGSSGALFHTLNRTFNGLAVVYFSPTIASSNIRLIPHGYISTTNQVGVWVSQEGSGHNSISYEVGRNGVYFDYEANVLRTTGYIRIVLGRA